MNNQLKVFGVGLLATGVVVGLDKITKGKIHWLVLGGIVIASWVVSAIYFERVDEENY